MIELINFPKDGVEDVDGNTIVKMVVVDDTDYMDSMTYIIQKGVCSSDDYNGLFTSPLLASINIGKSFSAYEKLDGIGLWSASYRDLTDNGIELYNLLKLTYGRDVKILTFVFDFV